MSAPREAIFAAVSSQLKKIRRDNGYGTDVGNIFRVDLLHDQLADGDFPALEVLESLGGESMTPLDPGGYFCRMQMTVAGLMKSGTADLKDSRRHSDINIFLDDTRKALMEDVTFAGACKESALSNPIVYVDPDRGEATFNLTLTCIYAFGRSDL